MASRKDGGDRRTYPKRTTEDKGKIVELILSGLPQPAVAARMNCSLTRVERIYREYRRNKNESKGN